MKCINTHNTLSAIIQKGCDITIVLDYRDKRPIYEQIVEKLEHLIIQGALESNTKLPSVRSLAIELSVNPNTIQKAYAQMEKDGYLYTVVGRGNYVTSEKEWRAGKVQNTLTELTTLLQYSKEIGITKKEILSELDHIYEEETGND